jgi:hypothetical protein
MNCKFYLPGSRRDCSESGAEPHADRDRANFCDWFSLNPGCRTGSGGKSPQQEKAAAAKTAFDNLFN